MERENQNKEPTDTASLDSLPQWLRDLIDYSNESAGRETGRTPRFFTREEREDRVNGGRKAERRFNELLRMLQNPAYALLYTQALETVERIDLAADRARQKLERESAAATEQLRTLKAKAAELPDGRKVFRAKDGRLIAEDGTDVSAKKDSVTWLSPETSSWEEFQSAQIRLEQLQQHQRDIDDYMREVIEPFKERLADTENPPTEEELREFQRISLDQPPPILRAEIDGLLDERSIIKPSAPVSSSAADKYVSPTELPAPDLLKQFSAASSVIAEDAFAPPTREPYGSQATQLPATTPKT